jgi:serine/threonine protein kinase
VEDARDDFAASLQYPRKAAGMSSLPAHLDVGQTVGDYEILSLLGRGGMGKVFKVRNLISDRIEAMKVLLPDTDAAPELASLRKTGDRNPVPGRIARNFFALFPSKDRFTIPAVESPSPC